jgi:hypothetical protein
MGNFLTPEKEVEMIMSSRNTGTGSSSLNPSFLRCQQYPPEGFENGARVAFGFAVVSLQQNYELMLAVLLRQS